MKISNYDEVVSQLRAKLPEYLAEKAGYQEGHNFKCLSPNHTDKNPSCGIVPSKDRFHCFSCGCIGDIFDACKILEGKPASGPGFIQENLMYLADKYAIHVESAPLTEEEIYELDTYRAYKTVSDYVTHSAKTALYEKAVKEREWTTELCTDYGIGCIADHQKYIEHMKTLGFTKKYLEEVDLVRDDLFGGDKLVFTIRDEHGRPVGFASRNLAYKEDKSNGAKYCNQKHTGIKVNIYKKSERLFGLSHALAHRKKKDKEIFIFEGYSDVMTAAQNGVYNCVAIGGLALTVEQVLLLKQHNYYDFVICLDGDDKGQTRTAELLDKVLAGHKDLNIQIMRLPMEMDPDDFIRAKGIKEFKKIKKWSAFEWRLSQFGVDEDGDTISKAMIPLIVNETSFIEQDKQCKALAKATGIVLRVINSEVDRLSSCKEAEKARNRDTILESLQVALSKDPDAAEFALQEAEAKLYDLARQYNEDSFSEESCIAILDQSKSLEEAKDGSFSGFILGPQLKNFQDALCGEWRKDVWMAIGGKANSGKTSFMCKLAYEIARNEADNNAVVIYHSIDDTKFEIQPKFISVAEGSRKITLNQIRDPNYYCKVLVDEKKKEDLMDRRDTGYSLVRELMKKGRIVIKDANDGDSMAYADKLIRYYKAKFPDRNIVYILDNFHKSKDFQNAKGDERVRFKTISTMCKSLATRLHCTVITTVEYKKIEAGKRASNGDIGETGQIEYDANVIAHVRNEVHERGDQAALAFVADVDGVPTRMPIIELDIGKNKVTSFKNKLYYNFYPASADFEMVPEGKIAGLLRKAEEKEVKEDESILGK